MECRASNDVYLLLKSSDFITHDLEHAFDGCESSSSAEQNAGPSMGDEEKADIHYHLVLRKTIPAMITSLEFRCFVRRRKLLAICQRDLNHYDFLPELVPLLQDLIVDFFEAKLRDTFTDENFVFDVYVPQPNEKGRVWLIDINPWAPRTDPLLFSWMEILGMRDSHPESEDVDNGQKRLSVQIYENEDNDPVQVDEDDGGSSDASEQMLHSLPEFRLVNRDDPEAYSFNTPQYSAHKLPKDVVDASGDGESGLREFMGQWRDIVARQERESRTETEN